MITTDFVVEGYVENEMVHRVEGVPSMAQCQEMAKIAEAEGVEVRIYNRIVSRVYVSKDTSHAYDVV